MQNGSATCAAAGLGAYARWTPKFKGLGAEQYSITWQWVLDPALDPDRDSVWILSLRATLIF
jgi:hypothetical protein